ncbi:MAG TPA: electron transport complex subunit RsxC [Rhodocyclaceae bacterium]|nr:electron transport complex subunit RsxC [Rhodocyclaceae bacterium]HNA05044.1 electron transport complex subunit RsxC [Rhodocyclaceae bacterium]HNB79420.1 electron transport complex subunit RsxC [Rhodocyclaceae bacterium]HNC61322.1 electron transport complex subunit RsxC [Rhodocyclaceae bacterium]HNH14334.1 electron transport complex subunit RsxC [Rhodocyclaceae bacterium]
MMRELFNFHGGVKPETNKAQSTREPIVVAPLPPHLVVPLHQSIGGTPHPLVQAGERVLKGQRIGAADGNVSAAVHAPTSGKIVAVEPRVMAHTSGLAMLSVVIEPDGEEAWMPLYPSNYRSMQPDEIRDTLRDAGVVGLGGAVFPSHLKLKGARDKRMTLILNGAECEPYITCDDMLMRERAQDILRGAQIMRHMLGAQDVLIGIEDNKPEAAQAMREAARALGERMDVVVVPTRYPAGGAKQLIRVLTGIEVPHGSRSTDYGVQCFNVGTAYAIHETLNLGRPLISRIVTVSGNVERPRNYEVLFGTPMSHLVKLAGGRPDTDRTIMGGPMMGYLMPNPDVPVVKATNCVIAGSRAMFPPPPPEMPCIRCTACVDVCPADLQPHEMYWFARAKNFGKAQEYHLFDCIECGCCAHVCPSHIPLVDYYRFAKTEIWARERDKAAADSARERFEFRTFREEREKEEKAAKLAAKTAAGRQTAEKKAVPAAAPAGDALQAAAAAAQAEGTVATPSAPPQPATADLSAPVAAETAPAADPKKALIEAAIERARKQREAVSPKNTDNLSDAKRAEIAEIEARRAKIREMAKTHDEDGAS